MLTWGTAVCPGARGCVLFVRRGSCEVRVVCLLKMSVCVRYAALDEKCCLVGGWRGEGA